MDKNTIIFEKKQLIDWSRKLMDISNDLWFKSFYEGSWGIADVISHFIFWDKFVINNRLCYLLNGWKFPKITIDTDVFNKEASEYARSGIWKEELVKEFIQNRENLISVIQKISPEKFEKECPGMSHITLGQYFVGLIQHDKNHQNQIDEQIKKHNFIN